MVCLKYAAYFSYTISQVSCYSNMLQSVLSVCRVRPHDLKLFNNHKIRVCTDELTDAFYDAMGPDEEAEESNTSSEDDSEATEKPELYHVSDESGEMQIEKIGEGSFEQDTLLDKVMLNAHDNSTRLQGFRESYAFLCLLC